MRTRLRHGLMIGLTLVLAGCGTGFGPIDFPKGQSTDLVDGALSELEKHPFLSFTGEVDDFVDGHDATVTIGISDAGLMYGTAKVGDAKLKLLSVDGKYFVNADTAFWKGYDHDEKQAKVLGGDWSPVDPKEFFDPGSVLATKMYVAALKSTLREVKAADSWRQEPTEKHGDRCYPLEVRDGTMCVTVDKPHRIIHLDDVPVTYKAGKSEHTAALDLELGALDTKAVKSWAKDLRAAVKDLSPVYAYGGVSMAMSSDGFFCSGTTCTFTALMGAEDLPKFQTVANKVKVGFKGVATTDSGQSQSCTATVTVKVGTSELADCSVTFSLRPGESQSVSAEYQSTGLMTFKPDTRDLGKQVKKDVKKILDKL
ncbi:hypothetical protein [Stackebrandtia nassauensis]|uniref:Lipoprotein n=1 Tax=Stackebrandtia nassauensis (strain DSM 44728 / CIP 108903 / NRRL B-16338 / NBRC 102104 / LLR-40K-21) TaxID=446470 RepID=D3PXL0_STANL|nr:hypothetical protein [Stackebrandtia nassauensis]ADD43340.1 hypothetical protein Snas_3683 [Stackebrandtia nassauensis DSM 44728]